jgi:hypothetical protein
VAKKPKTFALRALADAARLNNADMPRLLKSLGVKPLEEVVIGGRTYRAYDQAALDAVTAWRAEKDAADAAPAQPPTPEPALGTQAAPDLAEINNGLAYLDRKLDQVLSRVAFVSASLASLTAQINALNTEMVVGVIVLDGVAASLPDDC